LAFGVWRFGSVRISAPGVPKEDFQRQHFQFEPMANLETQRSERFCAPKRRTALFPIGTPNAKRQTPNAKR
jgi:hypothetical protein